MSETQDFSKFIDKMTEESWPKDAIDRAVENITDTMPNSTITMAQFRQMVMAAEDELEAEQKRKEQMLQRRREEEEEAANREKLRQEKIREEKATSPTLENQINNYLIFKKNVKAVGAREVADCLFSKLSDVEKQDYYNRPLFAASEMLDTPTFDAALNECIKKYHNSVTMQKKINDYLDKVTPERDRDEQQIDKLIESLPDYRKTLDDRTFQAYTAICWLEEEAPEMKDKKAITAEEIKEDIDLERELNAAVAVEVQHGEPYDVAYRSGMEKVTAKVFKKVGHIRSMPRHYVDVAKEFMAIGDRETLGDNLYEKVQQDKALKAIADEYEAEYKKKVEELEEKKKEFKEATKLQQQVVNSQPVQYGYNQQNRGYGYNQQNRGYGYNQNNRGYRNNGFGQFPAWMQHAAVCVVLELILLLIDKITNARLEFSMAGVAAAAFFSYKLRKGDKNSLLWLLISIAVVILPFFFL